MLKGGRGDSNEPEKQVNHNNNTIDPVVLILIIFIVLLFIIATLWLIKKMLTAHRNASNNKPSDKSDF